MIKARVIDTETASLKGGVVEIAKVDFIEQDGTLSVIDTGSHLVNPQRAIEWGAMGIHGITPEMVAKAPTLTQVMEYYVPDDKVEYLVGHNISFDIRMLGDKFTNHKTICTLALARKLIDKKECGDHKNSTLFFYLGCYKSMRYGGVAHRALYDSYMTYEILKALMIKFNLTLEGCYDLINNKSKQPQQDDVCHFSKHKGTPWGQVMKEDIEYVEWLLNNFNWKVDSDRVNLLNLYKQFKGNKHG